MCGQACDVLPVAKMSQNNESIKKTFVLKKAGSGKPHPNHDQFLESTATDNKPQTLEEKLNEILGIGEGHHPYELCCDLCDQRAAILQAVDEAIEEIINVDGKNNYKAKDNQDITSTASAAFGNGIRKRQRARKEALLKGASHAK
jgi:hypothetical protein